MLISSKAFFAFSLLGIIVLLFTADGYGKHFENLSCVVFSPDGKQLAVAKHDARDSNTRMKFYLSNVSRTISVLRVPDLHLVKTVDQDLRRGNQGPAFGVFHYAPQSLTFTESSQTLTTIRIGEKELRTFDIDSGESSSIPIEELFPTTVRASAIGGSVVIGSGEEVWLIDTNTGQRTQRYQSMDKPFFGAPLFSIATNPPAIATVSDDSINIWNLTNETLIVSVGDVGEQHEITTIALHPALKQLAIGYNNHLLLYDLVNHKQQFNLPEGASELCYSPNGNQLAFVSDHRLKLLDVGTGEVRVLPTMNMITCINFSYDGDYLAAGNRDGNVLLWDTHTRKLLATAKPPGRYRHPCTLPIVLLIVWYFAFRRFKNRQPITNTSDEVT